MTVLNGREIELSSRHTKIRRAGYGLQWVGGSRARNGHLSRAWLAAASEKPVDSGETTGSPVRRLLALHQPAPGDSARGGYGDLLLVRSLARDGRGGGRLSVRGQRLPYVYRNRRPGPQYAGIGSVQINRLG